MSNGQSEVGNFTSSLLPRLCPRVAKINTISAKYKIPEIIPIGITANLILIRKINRDFVPEELLISDFDIN